MRILASFQSTAVVTALLDFNQSLPDFFSLVDSSSILTLQYNFLNLVVNGFQLSAIGGHSSEEIKLKPWLHVKIK